MQQPPNKENWQQPPNTQYPPPWQQPQYPPPPSTYYPPQEQNKPQIPAPNIPPYPQQHWQLPSPPPKKTNPRQALAIFACAILLLGLVTSALGRSSSSSIDQATPTTDSTTTTIAATDTLTPSHTLKWTTTHTFSGTGEKTTATFQTSGDWRLVWTAQALSDSDAFFGAAVYSSDHSIVDSGISGNVPAGKKTTDSTEEHTGAGSFYVKVFAGVPWSIQVQEFK